MDEVYIFIIIFIINVFLNIFLFYCIVASSSIREGTCNWGYFTFYLERDRCCHVRKSFPEPSHKEGLEPKGTVALIKKDYQCNLPSCKTTNSFVLNVSLLN